MLEFECLAICHGLPLFECFCKPYVLTNVTIHLSFIFINGYIAHFPEGWLELFLNAAEKRNFSRWTENINDKSITHRATKNTFDRIASLLPDTVAPNVITAAGFACLGEFIIYTLTFFLMHTKI